MKTFPSLYYFAVPVKTFRLRTKQTKFASDMKALKIKSAPKHVIISC